MSKHVKEAVEIFTKMGFKEDQIKNLLNSVQIMSNIGEVPASETVDELTTQL